MIQLNRISRLGRVCIATAVFFAVVAWAPFEWFARDADRWFAGDPVLQTKLANGVDEWLESGLKREQYATGSSQFDGEWLFGTGMIAAMGYGQCALEQPGQRGVHLSRMEKAIDLLLTKPVRAFDREAWDEDALESLDRFRGHAAYLGYLNLALSFHRLLEPQSKYADLNDRITDALRRRVAASPTLLVETYPGQTYPVDNCSVIASIALYDRACGLPVSELQNLWVERCRQRFVDPKTGLLFQAVDGLSGEPFDRPRGSGTILGLYMLSFADMELSAELYASACKSLSGQVFGFGGVREYPEGTPNGTGDIDSGPIVIGYGLSATGFLIGGARIHGDEAMFKTLVGTAYAAGAPHFQDDTLHFVSGASLGDAILFAMLTAQPGGILEEQP